MKKISAVIISLVVVVSLSACSQDVSSSSDRSIRRLEQQNEELEAENSELRAQLGLQEESSEQSSDDQIQSFLIISSITDSPEASNECGENLTWYYKDGVLYITGSGEMIRNNDLTKSVLWGDLRDKIDCVIVEEGVTSIGGNAFGGCSNLTEITIPNSVTSIGDYAFMNCSNLTEITIPNSVTSIGDYAFKNCSNLTEITIPNSVTSIGDYAFKNCSIGNEAFYNCSSLTEITIPNSVTSIGDYAFKGCSNLTEITIPDSVTSIGDYAFKGCSNLTEITIPDSVTSIGNGAFYDCSSLTEITIPDSVTSIDASAFIPLDVLTNYYSGDAVDSEKINVVSDLRLCDTVRSAITTAMIAPSVCTDPSYTQPTGVNDLATVLTIGGSAYENAVLEILGADSAQDIIDRLKSTCHDGRKASSAGIMVEIQNGNNVIVYVPGGCGRAEKDSCDQDCGGLYCGGTPPTIP